MRFDPTLTGDAPTEVFTPIGEWKTVSHNCFAPERLANYKSSSRNLYANLKSALRRFILIITVKQISKIYQVNSISLLRDQKDSDRRTTPYHVLS